MNDRKSDRLFKLILGSAITGMASAGVLTELNKLSYQDIHNIYDSPKGKALWSYYDKLYNKAQTKEARDSILDEHMEQYEALKDTYKQLKKQIDQAKAKIPRNKYGTPKFDSPEYLNWKRLQQIAIQEGYLPEDYVPDYNFE